MKKFAGAFIGILIALLIRSLLFPMHHYVYTPPPPTGSIFDTNCYYKTDIGWYPDQRTLRMPISCASEKDTAPPLGTSGRYTQWINKETMQILQIGSDTLKGGNTQASAIKYFSNKYNMAHLGQINNIYPVVVDSMPGVKIDFSNERTVRGKKLYYHYLYYYLFHKNNLILIDYCISSLGKNKDAVEEAYRNRKSVWDTLISHTKLSVY